jgi:hypothetical protein
MKEELLHLGPDEIDLWIEGRLPHARTSHLETCLRCSAEAQQSRDLIQRLAALPTLSPSSSLADRIMQGVIAGQAEAHLSAEELDRWTLGTLAGIREQHLHSWSRCREAADADRVLVRQLEALPLLGPTEGFSERVLDGVHVPVTSLSGAWRLWRRRVASNPIGVAIAASVAVILGGSVAASAAWAAGNQDMILGVGNWLRANGELWAWQGLGMTQSFLDQQGWYAALRSSLTPGRLAALGTLTIGLYAGGMLALRRLLALPEAEVARTAP